MITLTVTSLNGAPVSHLACSFDETGGTIGRAENNQLVLPDPERAISRIHAQIVFRGGSYALVGRGANPVVHNGRPMEHGSEVVLAQGDQIDIGAYRIAVTTATAAAVRDPFDEAFGRGGPLPAAAVATPPRPAAPVGWDEDLAPLRAPTGARSVGGIPEDWDPFAPDPGGADPFGQILQTGGSAPPAGTAPPRPSAPPVAQDNSIDALFGLKPGPVSADPLAASPLAAMPAQPNTAAAADPMRALQQAARPVAAPQADHASDLAAPWSLAMATPVGAPASPPLRGAVYSWDSPQRDGHVVTPSPATAVHNSGGMVARGGAPGPAVASPAGQAGAPQARSAAPAGGAGSIPRDEELLAALLEGLGVPTLPTGPMRPELLRLVGQLLRASTQGTVDLLAARTALKREVRADVTTILADTNNALKFSPSAEIALQYLLGPKVGGFLPPVDSMRDAYDDLRAHQLGVMAGMKAALAGVLERFDPAAVEGKMASMSAFSSLIPSSRKARLWELFQDTYRQLATEAEEDFNTLFGAAFLKAYQQHVDRLKGRG